MNNLGPVSEQKLVNSSKDVAFLKRAELVEATYRILIKETVKMLSTHVPQDQPSANPEPALYNPLTAGTEPQNTPTIAPDI